MDRLWTVAGQVPSLQLEQDPPGFFGEFGLDIEGQGLLEGCLAFGFCFKLVLGHAEVVEEFAIVRAGLEALLEGTERRRSSWRDGKP